MIDGCLRLAVAADTATETPCELEERLSATPDLIAPEAARAACAVIVEAARSAGKIALGFFNRGGQTHASIETKEGGSPVTEADVLCDQFLEKELRPRFPEAGWLSEEIADDLIRLDRKAMLIVDPIDGTRGFVEGDPRWAVCVALVVHGRPVAGVVHAPALDETYAAALGAGATLNGARIWVSACTELAGARAAGPKPLAAAVERAGVPLNVVPKIPSLAYRLVRVASGAHDVAFTSGDAHDWDIAAADLVVREAGGCLAHLDGTIPLYNTREARHGVLVASSRALFPALRDAVGQGVKRR